MPRHAPRSWSRRELLARAGGGMGLLALADLARGDDPLRALTPRSPHHRPRAKSVIWLFMNGGQSQVDTWDHKPALERYHGTELEGFDKETGFFPGAVGTLMKSPFAFRRHGESGSPVSELFPHLARHVDEIAFVHSCHTESNNHAPAILMANTGMTRLGFPCAGSWVTYGLGSPSENLPSFVVMYDTKGRGIPKGHSLNWSAGFLPGVYQGTALQPRGEPIANLARPGHMTDADQRRQLDLLARLNREHSAGQPHETELEARIESFELAYRMQAAAPEVLDLRGEPASTTELYGLDDPACQHFARQCVTARRLVERGVRFVQIYSGGMANQRSWDGHQDIRGNHAGFARETDRPIAGLLADLRLRGLLDETLVVYGGEFGRLPMAQTGAEPGRDHNPHAFTYWFAGGGVRGGHHHGETDELGHRAEVDRVSINDLHATILHLVGIDHERLTYTYNGRPFRLTDVAGHVIAPILS